MRDREKESKRKHHRAPVALEVHYRTTGSFLVSYSLNISKGGLFLETPDVQPVGTRLSIRFTIPGADEPIEAKGQVIWVRKKTSPEGFRPGFGVAFDSIDAHIGAQIDGLVRGFDGVVMMAVAADAGGIDRLARYLQNALTCSVVRAPSVDDAKARLGEVLDLILLDLDSAGKAGLDLVEAAAQRRIPLVALTRDAKRNQAALVAGAALVLHNPPPPTPLRDAILELLGSPGATT